MPGFEPGASYMRSKRSTAELHPLRRDGQVKFLDNLDTFFMSQIMRMWKLTAQRCEKCLQVGFKLNPREAWTGPYGLVGKAPV